MVKSIRQPTLDTLGLGSVHDIFSKGQLPAKTGDLVDKVFGPADNRGSLVITGANGIVGAGKTMQLGSRLQPYQVPIIALDLPGSPPGINGQYKGLVRAFGRDQANKIMDNIIQLTYDGSSLPGQINNLNPRFLLEAIPEILELKKSHYKIFRDSFPEIEIRSVTSGFPNSQLGVGISHPAFPHEINKVWEMVEDEPSDISRLLWALGLIPMPMGDHWSFVLDVLFCGLTLTGLRYHQASNMPFWKLDKFLRKLLGPNPFRAHDAIGAKGANFLTWSCLHHLEKEYGPLFQPTTELIENKDSGMNWYPMNHFRPLVDWSLNEQDQEEFETWILGPLCQMTALMVHEKRAHFSYINSIGEICAQFRQGTLAVIRNMGKDAALRLVDDYHHLHPEARDHWHPEVLDQIDRPEWQHLYVNAEHDGSVGVITIGRESYNHDVDCELNLAIDWLKKEGIKRVIATGDFHLATQMVGADINDFFPALEEVEKGSELSKAWSKTARRLHTDFERSVGFVNGKRCLGGMLELLLHCHYLVAHDGVKLGFPEVTIPVVPGMEGCHWPFRKTGSDNWPRLMQLLLEGGSISASDAAGWLIDHAAPLEEAIQMTWKLASEGEAPLPLRKVEEGALRNVPRDVSGLSNRDGATEAARKAIVDSVVASSEISLAEALEVQARHTAEFMAGPICKKGSLGAAFKKTMAV